MMGRTVCVIGLALVGLSATPARAQERGDVGLAIAVPTSIGVIWHASDGLAIRPDFSFGFSGTEGEQSLPDSSSKNFTFGVSALFYTHRWDDFRFYVSPRFAYSHGSTSIDEPVNSGSTLSSWSAIGSIGGQYALGSRFSVFAETGLSYGSQRSETEAFGTLGLDRTTWSFGTRAAVGGILYF